jgi:hypothetical protein
MNLLNFDLSAPRDAIELAGLGLVWDLHNVLRFRSLEFNPASGELRMSWVGTPNSVATAGHVLDNPSQYGGCLVLFRGVQYVHLSGPGTAAAAESATLHAINWISPDEGAGPFDGGAVGERCLSFEFMSGLVVEIAAAEAKLVGISLAAA